MVDWVLLSHCLSGRKGRDAAQVVMDGSTFWLHCMDSRAQPATAEEFVLKKNCGNISLKLYQGDPVEEKQEEVPKTA